MKQCAIQAVPSLASLNACQCTGRCSMQVLHSKKDTQGEALRLEALSRQLEQKRALQRRVQLRPGAEFLSFGKSYAHFSCFVRRSCPCPSHESWLLLGCLLLAGVTLALALVMSKSSGRRLDSKLRLRHAFVSFLPF